MSDTPELSKCQACGYIHPPPLNEHCEVAKRRRKLQNEETRHIYEFISWLSNELENSKNSKSLIAGIKKLMQLKSQKK
jgi:uncharacterized OB-fold protein